MAATPEGARLAVAGHPFGRYPDDRLVELQGIPVARLIVECLGLTDSDTVLEVGCGIGRLARHIVPLVHEYHGADISPVMCMRAAEQLSRFPNAFLHWLPDCSLRTFEDESVDAVFIQHVLVHLELPDIVNYLREAHRVLLPGGRIYTQFYNRNHPQGFDETVHAVDQRIRDGIQQRGRVYCHSAREVEEFLTGAGFELDPGRSHLEPCCQRRDWWPDNDFFFWLIGTGIKR